MLNPTCWVETHSYSLFKFQITKPLLERQRRARINRCLDELKDILITGLQAEGENVARLEKADILELTVRHLHKLQTAQTRMEVEEEEQKAKPIGDDERFRAGYAKCAQEVSRALAQSPTIDIEVGTSLMVHLGHTLNQISSAGRTSPPTSPRVLVKCPSGSYSPPSYDGYRPCTPPSSPQSSTFTVNLAGKAPWRPW